MRILHVLRAPLGGLFRHVCDLTHAQIALGHSVGLVVDSLTDGDRAVSNLESHRPHLQLGILRLPMKRAPDFRDLATVVKVERHARKLDADVVHGHGSKGGLYARAPGFFPRASKLVRCYTPHGGSFNHVASPMVQALYMGVETMLAKRTDVLLFESIYIANSFHKRIGETKALVRIVQNGISPGEFVPVVPDVDAASFIYIGELRSAKGIDTLIDATALLSKQRRLPLKLILVGSGPDQEKLTRRAASLGISDNVSFPGAMPARRAFKLGRTLVVPSRAESLPYIVLEAAGARMPMIATDVGGISEVFGPYRDRLIGTDDAEVLARDMARMLDTDPAVIQDQTAELAAFVEPRFSIANMADAVIAGYRDGQARRLARVKEPSHSFAIYS